MTDQSKPRNPRALNAYRHGLTGQVHIATPADQVAYDKHCRGIHESFAPVGAMETDLVQSIADDRWRLKRAVAIENSIFAIGLGEPDTVTAHHEEIDAAFAQARVWLSEGKNLQLLGLYEHRIQRRVEKNVQMLRQLQQDRKAAPQAERPAQPAINKGSSAQILPTEFDFSNILTAANSTAVHRSTHPINQAAPCRREACVTGL